MIVGLGPVHHDSIENYRKNNRNFEEVKRDAIDEFLSHFLKYSEEEIEDLKIRATHMAEDNMICICCV